MVSTIVKKLERKQKFSDKKIYKTCYSACLSSQIEPKKSEEICKKVIKQIKNWLKGKKEITSDEISKKAHSILQKYNEDAAFMYKTHRDIG